MAMQESHTLERVDLFAATQAVGVSAVALAIAEGQDLKRGALLKADGSQVSAASDEVYAVLAEDVDTSAAAKEAPVYLCGEFNVNALSVAEGVTVAEMVAAARKVGIFIK